MTRGRKPKLCLETILEIQKLYRDSGARVVDLAKQYNVSVPTIYNLLKKRIVMEPVLNMHGENVEAAEVTCQG